MSDTNSLTSANSSFVITAPPVFVTPYQMMGYASDKAFTFDATELAEVNMGVDGRMTGGFVPTPVKQAVSLQGDSPSKEFFALVMQYMKARREIVYLTATITLPSTGEVFALTRGILTSGHQIPSAQKILQPVEFSITWQSVNRSLL